MNKDKWAVTLRLGEREKLEDRVVRIVECLAEVYPNAQWNIEDIDATGEIGGNLAQNFHELQYTHLSSSELLNILSEDGQVIELLATMMDQDEKLFRIIIRDGISVDVLGTGDLLSASCLGPFDTLTVELFGW